MGSTHIILEHAIIIFFFSLILWITVSVTGIEEPIFSFFYFICLLIYFLCWESCQKHLRILRVFHFRDEEKKKKKDRKKGGDADFKICHFLTPILFSDADIDCVSCAGFFSDIFRAFEWIRPDLKADILFLSISFFVMEPSHLKHTVKHFISFKVKWLYVVK